MANSQRYLRCNMVILPKKVWTRLCGEDGKVFM